MREMSQVRDAVGKDDDYGMGKEGKEEVKMTA